MSCVDRLEKVKERLENYYAAEQAVLTGQEYRIGSRMLQRADLDVIQKTIKYLEEICEQLENGQNDAKCGTRKAFRITPRDL